jgi:hypothetical protein
MIMKLALQLIQGFHHGLGRFVLPQDGFRSCLYRELAWYMGFHRVRTTSDFRRFLIYYLRLPRNAQCSFGNPFMTLCQQRISAALDCIKLFHPFLLSAPKSRLRKPIRESKLATDSLLNSNLYPWK